MEGRYYFNLRFLKALTSLHVCLFKGSVVTSLLFLLLVLLLLEEFLIYQVGIITSAYYTIMSNKNFSLFLTHTAQSLFIIFSMCVVKSSRVYVKSLIYITWRKQLTSYLHQHYFRNDKYYELNSLDKSVDNPDQRITQDVDKMCLNLSTLLPTLLISPFTISYYIYNCQSITGWLGPVAVFCYFILGTLCNKVLVSAVSQLVYLQEKLEGYFRFKHMHIRMNAEAVAFQCGERTELRNVSAKLNSLINLQEGLCLRQLPLDISVNIFNYVGSVISFFLIAVPLFSGRLDNLSSAELSGLISKNAFVTIYLISCFSNLVGLSEPLATLVGTTHRISQLRDFLLRGASKEDPGSKDSPQGLSASGSCNTLCDSNISDDEVDHPKIALLQVNELNLSTPGQPAKILVRDLSFQVQPCESLLVTGPSGCGKTALLRTIKGLWHPWHGGTISLDTRRTFFLPQRPVLTDGSLRQQIMFPHSHDSPCLQDDETLLRYLEDADLSSVVERVGGLDSSVSFEWYEALSPGEIQRLCFLRLLYHRPQIGFLDECLSSISPLLEETLYQAALDLGITLVSVGHRQTLRRFHSHELKFEKDGGWTLLKIS